MIEDLNELVQKVESIELDEDPVIEEEEVQEYYQADFIDAALTAVNRALQCEPMQAKIRTSLFEARKRLTDALGDIDDAYREEMDNAPKVWIKNNGHYA